MSSRIPEPCDATIGAHDGELRFYACGWRCDVHAPWAVKGLPPPTPVAGIPATAVTKTTT